MNLFLFYLLLLLPSALAAPAALRPRLPSPLPTGWVQLDPFRLLIPVAGPFGDPLEVLRLNRQRRSSDCNPEDGGPFDSETHTSKLALTFDVHGLITAESVRSAHVRLYRLPISGLSPSHASQLLGLSLFEVVRGQEMRHVRTKSVRPEKLQQGRWRALEMTNVLLRWLRSPEANQGLELWTRNVEPKRVAKWLAKHYRFASPTHEEKGKRPMLLVHFR